ncbi:hypothetical protein [Cellvibrio sp. pealriver]|uniref:hypothetical protein n=1 Tax=Cellvibrio sp. pealriver TaxID=1622269 RepID=UPI0012E1B037|nr:hypothetical protein [Cellvibrio sp. pealriver]
MGVMHPKSSEGLAPTTGNKDGISTQGSRGTLSKWASLAHDIHPIKAIKANLAGISKRLGYGL